MQDEVAEWLRRWTANPMGSARVGSNPILVVHFFLKSYVVRCFSIRLSGYHLHEQKYSVTGN